MTPTESVSFRPGLSTKSRPPKEPSVFLRAVQILLREILLTVAVCTGILGFTVLVMFGIEQTNLWVGGHYVPWYAWPAMVFSWVVGGSLGLCLIRTVLEGPMESALRQARKELNK